MRLTYSKQLLHIYQKTMGQQIIQTDDGIDAKKLKADRQKPRFYARKTTTFNKKKATLKAYYADKLAFLNKRAEDRKRFAVDAQAKWAKQMACLVG